MYTTLKTRYLQAIFVPFKVCFKKTQRAKNETAVHIHASKIRNSLPKMWWHEHRRRLYRSVLLRCMQPQ